MKSLICSHKIYFSPGDFFVMSPFISIPWRILVAEMFMMMRMLDILVHCLCLPCDGVSVRRAWPWQIIISSRKPFAAPLWVWREGNQRRRPRIGIRAASSFDRAAAGQVTTLWLSDTCHSARRGASSWCQLRRLMKRIRLDRWVYVPTCSRKVILTNRRAFFLIYLYGIERVDLPFAVWHLWGVS